MRQHVIVRLDQPLPEDLKIPEWVAFIHDKSVVRERLIPEVDRVFQRADLAFWATREYQPAGGAWSAAERREGLERTYRLILQTRGALPPDLVPRLKALPSVEDARALQIGKAAMPDYQPARAMSVTGPSPAELIYLSAAKAYTTGAAEIKIAVLDTGVNLNHPELRGRLVPGADFVELSGLDTSDFIGDITGLDDVPEDEVGHGTHVSGILAARGLEMEEGVCPGCKIMPVRVLAAMKEGGRIVGAGFVDHISNGIKWAVDLEADIINVSLGIRNVGGGLPHESVIRYALSKNVTVVAASGNDGTAERYYPGALPGVIAVGATDAEGAVAPFTSFGARITVVAPGTNIYSSYARGSYAWASGTSQASPFVCGAIGLMKSYTAEQGHRLTNSEIMEALRHTADRVDSRPRNERAGYGLLNLADAFKYLSYSLNQAPNLN